MLASQPSQLIKSCRAISTSDAKRSGAPGLENGASMFRRRGPGVNAADIAADTAIHQIGPDQEGVV